MARTNKKQSREEMLLKKKIRERKRREKIRNDPELHQQLQKKEKARYIKRKEEKKTVPIAERTPRERRIQRKQWRINSENYRNKKKESSRIERIVKENTPPDSEDEIQPVSPPMIKSPVINRKITRSFRNALNTPENPRPSTSSQCDTPVSGRTHRRYRYKIAKRLSEMQQKLTNMKKVIDTYKKRLRRIIHNKKSPRTKVENLLADPEKKEDVKKSLLFGEVVQTGLTQDYKNLHKKEKRPFLEKLKETRAPLKKYGLSGKLPVTRKKQQRKLPVAEKIKKEIEEFLLQDDNSRMCAGKKESKHKDDQIIQKRYLLEPLKELHKKFNNMHSYSVSYSFFCKARPVWVESPKNNSRLTCLCKMHANIDFILQSLRKRQITEEKSSTELLNTVCCDKERVDCLMRNCQICKERTLSYKEFDNSRPLELWQWQNSQKQIYTKEGERNVRIIEKKRLKMNPKEAIEKLESILPLFYLHSGNIRNQYLHTKNLKENRAENEAVIHMDFSENYSVKYDEEIQSFHFGGSRTQISLHTAVVYYFNKNSKKFELQCTCTASECLRHDALSVWAHLIPIIDFLKENSVVIEVLHLITDSTCSQYRNKTMFAVICKLWWYLPSLKCITWNYTEAGHGKGAADGVGGVLKNMADSEVNYGKNISTCAEFVSQMSEKVENVKIWTVSEYDIIEKDLLITPNLKTFKGTLKIHQILWSADNKNSLTFRKQSCSEGTCKNSTVRCTHGKHLAFYCLDTQEEQANDAIDIDRQNVSNSPPMVTENRHQTKTNSPPIFTEKENQAHTETNNDIQLSHVGNTLQDISNVLEPKYKKKSKIEILSNIPVQLYTKPCELTQSVNDISLELTDNLEQSLGYQNGLKQTDCFMNNDVANDDIDFQNFDEFGIRDFQIETEAKCDERFRDNNYQNVFEMYINENNMGDRDLPDPLIRETTDPLVDDVLLHQTTGSMVHITTDPLVEDDISLGETTTDPLLHETTDYLADDILVGETTTSSLVHKITDPLADNISLLGETKRSLQNEEHNHMIKVGSWVVVEYMTNKSNKKYIGQVVNDCMPTLTVTFLRKIKGTDLFSWPDHRDEDEVSQQNIIQVLSEPDIKRRGQLHFDKLDVKSIN